MCKRQKEYMLYVNLENQTFVNRLTLARRTDKFPQIRKSCMANRKFHFLMTYIQAVTSIKFVKV